VSTENSAPDVTGESPHVALNYIEAFRLSWLLDQHVDPSWFSQSRTGPCPSPLPGESGGGDPFQPPRHPPPISRVQSGRYGATRLLCKWANGDVDTELTAGDVVPRWFVLPGEKLRRLAVFSGQFLTLALARKHLHAPAVRLLKSQSVPDGIMQFYEQFGAELIPHGVVKDRTEKFDFSAYGRIGSSMLHAALHHKKGNNPACTSRLRIRLEFRARVEGSWTADEAMWAGNTTDTLLGQLQGTLL
jgi:hypothetical protein